MLLSSLTKMSHIQVAMSMPSALPAHPSHEGSNRHHINLGGKGLHIPVQPRRSAGMAKALVIIPDADGMVTDATHWLVQLAISKPVALYDY